MVVSRGGWLRCCDLDSYHASVRTKRSMGFWLVLFLGIPAVCLVSMAFAFFEPKRSWRWGVLPMVGQFVWMLISPGPGNLLPLGVIVFGVLSVPPIIAARIGAFIATKIR